jgi:hypothetical protein
MSEQQRPDALTRASVPEVYAALRSAWDALFGEIPARESLLVLLAQWALETGRGKSMHCYNLGNIKHVPGDGRDFTYFRCNEIINGKEVWFDPPHPACCFRAYPTLEAGAADYLALLQRRFSKAWPAVLAGDPAEFSHQLKVSRYYTADEKLYTKSVVSLFNEFSRAVPPDAPPAPASTPETDTVLADLAHNAIQQAGFQIDLLNGEDDEPDPPPDVA